MTYEKFMEQVKEQILSFLPEEYANADVTIQEVSKNNNQKFHAICIKRPEDRIVPNVYLEDYYRTYEDDGNMENILTAIARIYQKNMENNENLLPFEVKDYESVKNRLYVVALNRNNNQDYLRDAVRRDITETDITSVVRVLCTNNQEKGMSSFMVKSGMLEMWGISREEIYEQALKNTERIFKPDMRNIKEILLSGCMETLSEEEQEEFRGFLNLDIRFPPDLQVQEVFRNASSFSPLLPFYSYFCFCVFFIAFCSAFLLSISFFRYKALSMLPSTFNFPSVTARTGSSFPSLILNNVSAEQVKIASLS